MLALLARHDWILRSSFMFFCVGRWDLFGWSCTKEEEEEEKEETSGDIIINDIIAPTKKKKVARGP